MDMEKRPLTVSDVKIQGMPVSASFNVQTGVLTTDEAAVSDIAPYVNTATDYREAIILPTALSNAYKVSFVLDGRTREWVFADLDISLPKFNPGSQYTFGIYIDPTADIIVGRLEDVDAGNSSAPWDDGISVFTVRATIRWWMRLIWENGELKDRKLLLLGLILLV